LENGLTFDSIMTKRSHGCFLTHSVCTPNTHIHTHTFLIIIFLVNVGKAFAPDFISLFQTCSISLRHIETFHILHDSIPPRLYWHFLLSSDKKTTSIHIRFLYDSWSN